jgi:hypothetical protein
MKMVNSSTTIAEIFSDENFYYILINELYTIGRYRKYILKAAGDGMLRTDVYSMLESKGVMRFQSFINEFILILHRKSKLSEPEQLIIDTVVCRAIRKTLIKYEGLIDNEKKHIAAIIKEREDAVIAV